MSMNLGDNFSKQNKKPNFEGDHFTTLEEMKNYSDDFNPPMRVVTCEATDAPDNRGIYLYDETNEVDGRTGKYKKASGGSGGGITGELKWLVGRDADFDGWLLCDGRELNKSDYPALAAALGTSFGTPTDSSKFRLPDPRGKVVGVCSDAHALGADVGAEEKEITKDNLPDYNLTCSESGAHKHNYTIPGSPSSAQTGGSGYWFRNHVSKLTDESGAHTHTISLGGGGQAFNVMQPTLFIGNLFIHI